MQSQFPRKEPILKEGEIAWYQQHTKNDALFFSQVSIRDVFLSSGSWYYGCDKTITISASVNGVFRKDGTLNMSIQIGFIDRKILSFKEMQTVVYEVSGQKITPESAYNLPYQRAKPNHRGDKIKKPYDKATSVVPPEIEEMTRFCKGQKGNLRQRLITTAEQFNKPPSIIASTLQRRLGAVIPVRLIEDLELLEE